MFQGLDYPHLARKYSDIDNRVQERKRISTEVDETEDEEREIDEDPSEEEDAKDRREKEQEEREKDQANGQIRECAICHTVVDEANLGGSIANSEPPNTEGHLLCQCCVRKFSIRSGR